MPDRASGLLLLLLEHFALGVVERLEEVGGKKRLTDGIESLLEQVQVIVEAVQERRTAAHSSASACWTGGGRPLAGSRAWRTSRMRVVLSARSRNLPASMKFQPSVCGMVASVSPCRWSELDLISWKNSCGLAFQTS